MGKKFNWKKKDSKKTGLKAGHQGANSTLQQINSAIGGQDKIFNGGSPILFNAVKGVIMRVFKELNVNQYVQYAPGTLAGDIVEHAFNLPEPTVANVIDAVIAQQIANRALRHAAAINHTNTSGMAANLINQKLNDLNTYNEQQLETIEMSRPRLLDSFNSQHQNWVKEKEKFEMIQTSLMKAFNRCFGVTTLSTVKQYIDNGRFRRAWYEICTQNAAAGAGQMNTAVLLNEVNNMKFNAETTSFPSLESNLQMLEEQLVEHGEAPSTDEHRLYLLMKVLRTSPGKEFENQVNHVEMAALGYAEARQLFIRRAAVIASNKTLAGVNMTAHQQGESDIAALNKINQDKNGDKQKKKCSNCGKQNHYTKDCFFLNRECNRCGQKGHFAKNCKNDVMEVDNDKKGDNAVGSSQSFGSKFNKNSKVYHDDFLLTTENQYTATSHQTDHLIGDKVANYLLHMIGPIVCAMRLIRIILDSGASTHMLPKNMLCCNYRKSKGLVRLGDTENTLSIMGIGDTSMDSISDVLDVAGLLIGILSVSRFDKIQFRTEFINGKGNVYDVQGQLVLSSTLQSDGMYLVDPEYVEYLMTRSSPGIEQIRRQVSSVSVHYCETDDVLHNEEGPVKRSEMVSNLSDDTGASTHTKLTKVVQPWTLKSINGTSTNDCMELSTIPVSDGENHPSSTTTTTALEGETRTTRDIKHAHGAYTNDDIYTIFNTTGLNPLDILHRQMGHMGAARIKSMLKEGAIKGCKYTWKSIKDLELGPCDHCMVGRMRAKPEGKTTDHDWKPLEKIAIDYKGDFARKAVGDYRGFMLLVDYATNWVHADLVKSKNEHTRVLQDFKINFTLKYDKVWKVLQSDSESIFKSKRVAQWLRKNEVRLTLSTPYQHWQNGQVEVYVRIVMDKARTVMTVYNTPIKYWGYAVTYICYTLNHTTNTNTNMSAYEALTGQKPDISNFVPFYAPGVYHLTNDERKGPWAPKAKPCRMLGYADQYKRAYYILNIETGRVIVRENCVFNLTEAAVEIDEIDVDQGEDRDDIDEFEIMIEDSDDEETDDDNDVSDDEVENEDVLGLPDIELDPNLGVQEEFDYGGDNPYWHITNTELTTTYSLYGDWRHHVLLIAGVILPLPPNPKSVEEALRSDHADKWETAITKELDQFRLRNTFGPAEQEGQGMKTKLILYYKYDGDYNLVCKARMVVCGYSQRKGIDYFETYSPTTTTTTVFMILALAGIRNGFLCSFDVSAAFLEGKADTKMFAWLPKSIDMDNISKRIEILGNWYGSKQAGKIWNDLYDKIVREMDFERNIDNPCLYRWVQGSDYIYQTVHVDDGMMLCSTRKIAIEFMDALLTRVRKAVLFEEVKLYLSMDIVRSDDGRMFQVSQQRYVKENFQGQARNYNTPMSTTTNLRVAEPNKSNESLLPITGKLRYLADRTRPDILVALGEVSTGGAESPSDEHCQVADRIQSYLCNSADRALLLGGYGAVELFGYCDAAYISTGNSKSRLGSCLFVNYDCGAISSISRNDTTISHSSTEAEIKAIDMICREIVSVRAQLEFLGYEQMQPTKICVDNRSAIEICKTLKVRSAVKHINVRINYIRELINARVIELVFVPSKYNVADVLTKALARQDHERHTKILLEGHTGNVEEDILMCIQTYEYYCNMISNSEAEDALINDLCI